MKCVIYNTANSPFMRINKVANKYKEVLKKYNYTEENEMSYIELSKLEQFKELTTELNELIYLYSGRDEFAIEIRDD